MSVPREADSEDDERCPDGSCVFKLQDESFDHEFGREVIQFWQCEECGFGPEE